MHPANHLAGQSSPYLLQHLHNPVDWYPWGEAAFARARAENRLIFLSVGYSTCHWCHVMERECFEDETVADLLNASFVSVKVDREERPDVDRLHMNFLQATTGGGGWPMSVWLTPDLKPFYAGTYFPPEDRPGMPGFPTVLRRIAELWTTEPERLREQAEQVLGALAERAVAGAGTALESAAWRDAAVRGLGEQFDTANGGFGRAPKFPNPVFLNLLLDYAEAGGDARLRGVASDMALATLRRIVAGGIRDHLGGGFHRYAVDPQWRLPHFEKMLGDQALLAQVCLAAWQRSGEPEFRRAAEECLDYLESRMRTDDGAYCTAEDADSPSTAPGGAMREGAYYVWTAAEVRAELGETAARVFAHAYGIEEAGNLDVVPGGEFVGENLPYRAHNVAETATALGLRAAEVETFLASAFERLGAARLKRPAVPRDDKILCGWNGLVLSALARAAEHLGATRWADNATRLAGFLHAHLFDSASGRLCRSWREGTKGPEAFAEDYSFLIQGLLDLFATTQESRWLEWALRLQGKQDEIFRDPVHGGYFANAPDPRILIRLKDTHDGAEPAASSVAVRNKARLAALLHRDELRTTARQDAAAFSGTLREFPLALPEMLAALGWLERAPAQVVIVGDLAEPATLALWDELRRRPSPYLSVVVLHPRNRAFFEGQDDFFAQLTVAPDGQPQAYVCENYACQLPVSTPSALAELLRRTRPERDEARTQRA